jgi:hypothetical protein
MTVWSAQTAREIAAERLRQPVIRLESDQVHPDEQDSLRLSFLPVDPQVSATEGSDSSSTFSGAYLVCS